eukprot:CAMPEP_0180308542 /NCGR_PEP_ID=MMETSP0988-20121125/28558_1 /TAXON_ID=697907 /ORGANISM="non described non described, Strain CCMP2293" /LENGTH=221 /DNA_ID=CAMNT_0022292135 /DNA_START=58 /DNA_END=719 /DNA_ORIENTATION=-
MMRSVIVCSLLAALSSTATAFLPAPPLTLSGRGLATGVATRSPAVAVRRGHAAELRCTATRLDVPTLSPLLEASDLNEFTATLQRSKVVFVKLYQGRCRQCIALAPKFKSLAVEHSRLGEVVFMKVAADRLREIAKHAGITRAPTIQAYVDGVLYGQIEGSDGGKDQAAQMKSLVTDVVAQYTGFGQAEVCPPLEPEPFRRGALAPHAEVVVASSVGDEAG